MPTVSQTSASPAQPRLRKRPSKPKCLDCMKHGHSHCLNRQCGNNTNESLAKLKWVRCPVCGREVALTKKGTLTIHQRPENVGKFNGSYPCPASRMPYGSVMGGTDREAGRIPKAHRKPT